MMTFYRVDKTLCGLYLFSTMSVEYLIGISQHFSNGARQDHSAHNDKWGWDIIADFTEFPQTWKIRRKLSVKLNSSKNQVQ